MASSPPLRAQTGKQPPPPPPSSSSRNGNPTKPSLVTLPVELLQQISQHLDKFPDVACLRMTCGRIRRAIAPPKLGHQDVWNMQMAARRWKKRGVLIVCWKCKRLRHQESFAFELGVDHSESTGANGASGGGNEGGKGYATNIVGGGSRKGRKRHVAMFHCVDCGLRVRGTRQGSIFLPGSVIVLDGKEYKVEKECEPVPGLGGVKQRRIVPLGPWRGLEDGVEFWIPGSPAPPR